MILKDIVDITKDVQKSVPTSENVSLAIRTSYMTPTNGAKFLIFMVVHEEKIGEILPTLDVWDLSYQQLTCFLVHKICSVSHTYGLTPANIGFPYRFLNGDWRFSWDQFSYLSLRAPGKRSYQIKPFGLKGETMVSEDVIYSFEALDQLPVKEEFTPRWGRADPVDYAAMAIEFSFSDDESDIELSEAPYVCVIQPSVPVTDVTLFSSMFDVIMDSPSCTDVVISSLSSKKDPCPDKCSVDHYLSGAASHFETAVCVGRKWLRSRLRAYLLRVREVPSERVKQLLFALMDEQVLKELWMSTLARGPVVTAFSSFDKVSISDYIFATVAELFSGLDSKGNVGASFLINYIASVLLATSVVREDRVEGEPPDVSFQAYKVKVAVLDEIREKAPQRVSLYFSPARKKAGFFGSRAHLAAYAYFYYVGMSGSCPCQNWAKSVRMRNAMKMLAASYGSPYGDPMKGILSGSALQTVLWVVFDLTGTLMRRSYHDRIDGLPPDYKDSRVSYWVRPGVGAMFRRLLHGGLRIALWSGMTKKNAQHAASVLFPDVEFGFINGSEDLKLFRGFGRKTIAPVQRYGCTIANTLWIDDSVDNYHIVGPRVWVVDKYRPEKYDDVALSLADDILALRSLLEQR